ncbi:aminodeoxychorismate lyase [Frateuria aurantia]|uniref:Aminodeoxychorismate lyase n=1 Tax=Frateuria aurantia (strain ATCC 33424 / DSM 6220 / KCTC 2777 / LMG 1558 / NBRC 3245 / NCIMB 13370) TaxID=767434 RepID=H8L5T0_FRAAD|nr:aminodeoxychorismate lyase [Frateuria aurantia]AFC85830.1 aminodeoxychorismate lyase [Frateuria aurantia DSM 6220]
MSGRILIDGVATGLVPADDRGLAYGDGLFETVWVEAGRPRLWPLHRARLEIGCARLGLLCPDPAVLLDEMRQLTSDLPQAVVRLSLTRGSGPRGYAPPVVAQTRRILAASPAPATNPALLAEGVRLHSCATRWAIQPALAGLKHLNRLEQVLARAEWSDPGMSEGLMLDMDGRVVSATAANLFAVIDGRCLTPALDRCGVAGVARAWLLAQCPQIEVETLYPDDLQRASELFLSSSLRGVVPVAALDARRMGPGPWTRQLQALWQAMATDAAVVDGKVET